MLFDAATKPRPLKDPMMTSKVIRKQFDLTLVTLLIELRVSRFSLAKKLTERDRTQTLELKLISERLEKKFHHELGSLILSSNHHWLLRRGV